MCEETPAHRPDAVQDGDKPVCTDVLRVAPRAVVVVVARTARSPTEAVDFHVCAHPQRHGDGEESGRGRPADAREEAPMHLVTEEANG